LIIGGNKMLKIAQRMGITAQALKNLLRALHNPIAIYHNDPSNKDVVSVFTEVIIEGKHVVVSINVAKDGDVDINYVGDMALSPIDFLSDAIDACKVVWINKHKKKPSFSASVPAPVTTGATQRSIDGRTAASATIFQT
jgi:hypothetical protein